MIKLVFLVLYLLIGLIRVLSDFRQPVYKQRGYVRHPKIFVIALFILIWPLNMLDDFHCSYGRYKARKRYFNLEMSRSGNFKIGSESDGFRDIKWGTDISTLPDMEYHITDSGFRNVRLYIKKNDELKIGEAVFTSIYYGFWRNRLYIVKGSFEGYTNWISLKEAIFEKFGGGKRSCSSKRQYFNQYSWFGKTTVMMLGYDDILESGEFLMSSIELWKQRKEG